LARLSANPISIFNLYSNGFLKYGLFHLSFEPDETLFFPRWMVTMDLFSSLPSLALLSRDEDFLPGCPQRRHTASSSKRRPYHSRPLAITNTHASLTAKYICLLKRFPCHHGKECFLLEFDGLLSYRAQSARTHSFFIDSCHCNLINPISPNSRIV
jgi:hypothetical protein